MKLVSWLRPLWASRIAPLGRALSLGWQRLLCGLFNLRRRLFRKRLADYVVFVLDQELAERNPDQPWWYGYIPGRKEPMTLEYLDDALVRVADDPAVKGVVLLIKGAQWSLPQAQSLVTLFSRFRALDRCANPTTEAKKVIVHLEQINTPLYVAACGADRIFVPPLASWDVLGLRATPTFLKDTLAQLGIEMDVVQIAPWKSAMDGFARNSISPEHAEQLNWLLDSWYGDIVSAIAAGRGLASEDVRTIIDGAPWDTVQALARDLIDDIVYEDELPALLGDEGKVANLRLYEKTRPLLLRRPRLYHHKQVGVISLLGSIMTGESRTQPIELPILGRQTLGSQTAQQQIRAAREDESLAAVVLHVDSPGGSALASDLIWRELQLLQQEKPLVVYMGDVAASGGYYIAAPAHKIVAQPATLTGSIGVITGKPVTSGLYAKIQANRAVIQRGTHADLYADDQPWTGSTRAKVEESVFQIYGTFKQRVADGRHLPYENLDAIANGRVWTGTQAQQHGLVDALGDFHHAVAVACQLAELPTDGSVRVACVESPKAWLLRVEQEAQTLLGLTTFDQALHLTSLLLTGQWRRLFTEERCWLLADGLPRHRQ